MNELEQSSTQIRPSRRHGSRLTRWWHGARQQLGVYGLGVAAFVGALWLAYQFVEPAPPDQLTLATGDPSGAYHRFGLALQGAFAEEDISLELINTRGSADNLRRLQVGEVDAAFLQSGIASGVQTDLIEGLGSLYFEPVWLFSRESKRINRLDDLAGLRVAIGGEGSGTRAVAEHLLADSGVIDELDAVSMSSTAAAQALVAGNVDAAFFITAADTPMIENLLADENILLADLERSAAYARRNRWLINLDLPSGVLSLQDDQPPVDIRLLAVAATLVSRDTLHPALAELLLQSAAQIAGHDTLFSKSGRFPSADFLEFPVSKEALRYYKHGTPFLQRYLPFWAANLIDRLKVMALPFLALLIPLSRLLPPAYRWSIRKKVYRWYDDVQAIDLSSRESPDADNLHACLAALERVERETTTVSVPLSYANELFALRQHIDLVQQQVARRLKA